MIELIIDRRTADLGGFTVGRILPSIKRRSIGPFVFLDHMGPVDFPAGLPKTTDVRPHPHIGLSTLTFLLEGEIVHRDSVGSNQAIRPGEVNWMTAGSGITHSERFEKARQMGDRLHGLQIWVALPDELEETSPSFSHHPAGDLPIFGDASASGRLVAGEGFGLKSPVPVYSPMSLTHLDLKPGARTGVPADYAERAIYVVTGAVDIGATRVQAGQLAVLDAGQPVPVTSEAASTIVVFAGESLGSRYIDWNFVSSSRDRIEQAKADWRAGRMKLPDLDHDEFIPLPEPHH